MNRRFLSLALALTCAVLAPGTASAASIWTPLASGTSQTIAAIAAPVPGEVVFATGGGEIHYLSASGSFAKATLTPTTALPFTDLAMSPNGSKGVAVGSAGQIYASSDAGVDWTAITKPNEYSAACGGGTFAPISDPLYSVHFASASIAYITGANNDVLKTTDGGSHFNEINKNNSSCLANETFGDTAWASETTGMLLGNEFGHLYLTTDGLAGGAGGTTYQGAGVNGFGGGDRLAVESGDLEDIWAINPATGPTYFQHSIDGGANWTDPTLTDNSTSTSFRDVASGIGTNVIAAGASGDIYTSTDGSHFTRQPAPAPDETVAWQAAAFQPESTTAFVGGQGGALAMTQQANALPAPPSTPQPTPIVTPAQTCKVPKLAGKKLKAAKRALAKAHCTLGKVKGKKNKKARVKKQRPKAGTTLPAGTKVKVTLASP